MSDTYIRHLKVLRK